MAIFNSYVKLPVGKRCLESLSYSITSASQVCTGLAAFGLVWRPGQSPPAQHGKLGESFPPKKHVSPCKKCVFSSGMLQVWKYMDILKEIAPLGWRDFSWRDPASIEHAKGPAICSPCLDCEKNALWHLKNQPVGCFKYRSPYPLQVSNTDHHIHWNMTINHYKTIHFMASTI